MPLKEVFRRRQEYGCALQALFDAGAARPGCPAQPELLALAGLWVSQHCGKHAACKLPLTCAHSMP